MPDAYPLFVVRPDGVEAYYDARRALETWDSEYGEEFVEADWQLQYPEADYQLERIITHSIGQAVMRQEQLARMAPRAYGGATSSGPPDVIRAGNYQGANGADNREGARGSDWLAAPPSEAGREDSPSDGQRRRYGETARRERNHGNFMDEFLPPDVEAVAAGSGAPDGSEGVPGGPLASGATAPATGGGAPESSDDIAAAAQAGGEEFTALSVPADENNRSIRAESRSEPENKARRANWANTAAARGAPITRAIPVVVHPEQLSIAPISGAPASESTLITFYQSQEGVLNELAAAIRNHIEEWGSAGRGMYWRPTLALQVTPDSLRQAERLRELLADSGVDVRLDQVAALPEVGPTHATK
jgi:hypothetical protein